MRRFSHWIARLWARLYGWLLGVCVLASAFGPFDTFRESCVQDGPFRVNFQARSGPFSTMEWRNVQMGIKLLPGTGKMKSKAICQVLCWKQKEIGFIFLMGQTVLGAPEAPIICGYMDIRLMSTRACEMWLAH